MHAEPADGRSACISYADPEGPMSTPRPRTRSQAQASQRQKGKGATRSGGRGKVWAIRLGLVALVGFILAVAAFFVAYATVKTPQPNDLANAQASIIYYRDGKTELDLSAKEFALLETFMRRPGEVLSRFDLLESAWDLAYENRSNVVDVYVRYLREKIDRRFGIALIETVRGTGYRLREEG